jgi:hypothetical protein
MTGRVLDQLSLFEVEKPTSPTLQQRLATIGWSYSRRSTLEQCARRYYYTYFGANKRVARDEPQKAELHLLKGLSTRHERTGTILHQAVAWYLRRLQRSEVPSLDHLLAWAGRLFTEDRAYSRMHPDGGESDPQQKFSPVLLREYHYRQPNAEALCNEAEARMLDALIAFATAACYESFRASATVPGALIEHPIKWRGLACRVEGKVDLAFENSGRPTVVDWKLGRGDGTGADSLQWAADALWAIDHFGCEPGALRVCMAHLGSSTVTDFRADTGILAAARARIVQDAVRMAAVQRYGEAGIAEAFTPCLKPAVCCACPFQRACPEGSQLIDA